MADETAALNRIHRVVTGMLMQELSEREALAEVVSALEAAGRPLLDDMGLCAANDNQVMRPTGA